MCALAPAQDALQVSDTGAQVKTWSAAGLDYSAVSRDGGSTWVQLPAPNHELNWRGRTFDPKQGDPSIPASLAADASNKLFYVQFETDIIPEYAVALEQLGAEYTRYYPNQAYITRIAPAQTDTVSGEPYVRAVMAVTPGHKLDAQIQVAFLDGTLGTGHYNIMLLDKHRDAELLEARIVEIGGVLESPAAGGIVLEATLTPTQLIAVA